MEKEQEYYYNYDVLCHEYYKDGVIHRDEETYAKSYEDLCKHVRDTFNDTYEDNLEEVEEYGPITVDVLFTDDPDFHFVEELLVEEGEEEKEPTESEMKAVDNDSADMELELEVSSFEDQVKEVFKDHYWTIYKPSSKGGFITLAQGTKWCAGHNWNHKEVEYDDIDDNSYYLRNFAKAYIIVNNANTKKRWLFFKGYGGIIAPSLAYYSCATWVSKQQDEELTMWFLREKLPYITTNLNKKVGYTKHLDTDTFVYPSEIIPDFNGRERLTNIKHIEITPGTKTIKDCGGFQNVEELIIPEGVTRISRWAFGRTTSLKKLVLPSTLKQIGNLAFYGCPNLKTVFIPKSVVKIGDSVFENVWGDANSDRLTIYCEATEKPEGWVDSWNNAYYKGWTQEEGPRYAKFRVVWGATRPAE